MIAHKRDRPTIFVVMASSHCLNDLILKIPGILTDISYYLRNIVTPKNIDFYYNNFYCDRPTMPRPLLTRPIQIL